MGEPVEAIRIDGVSYRYGDGREALTSLSFSVASEEVIGLIGPNGAGKTTLFLCLCGILKPQAGAISVMGLDPQNAKHRKQLPSQVGIVFQNSDDQLFSSTIFEDVAFGPLNLQLPPDEVRFRVTEALQKVGLSGYEERVPFHLSGGEKRRAAIAGVLAMRPSVLLLDEPSMFLDPRGRRELIKLIQTLPGTKLIATHDLRLVEETCSRVILLDEGKLLADGPTRDIMANQELMSGHGL